MRGNTDNCQLVTSTKNAPELQIGDSLIKTSSCKQLLGVKIDYKLIFDEHVKSLHNELRALNSATPYMNMRKECF